MLLKKSLITASLLAAMSVPAIAEDVKIGVPSWTGAQAMAHFAAIYWGRKRNENFYLRDDLQVA